MERQVILNSKHFELTINRLCYQLIETHNDFSNTVLIGLQPRGVNVLERIKSRLEVILGKEVVCGKLDITFYRDDFRRRDNPIIPSTTNIDFVIENKHVHHAYLFYGEKGSGKLATALSFAKHLTCTKNELIPCNECSSWFY